MSGAYVVLGIGAASAALAIWVTMGMARVGRRRKELELGAVARDALASFADQALTLEAVNLVLQHGRDIAWRLFGSERVVAIESGIERGSWDAYVPGGESLGIVPGHHKGVFAWLLHNRNVVSRGDLQDARFGAMRAPLGQLMDLYQVDVWIPMVEHGQLLAVMGLQVGRPLTTLDNDVLKLLRLEVTAACANIKLHRQAAHALSMAKEMDLTSAVKLALVPDKQEGSSGVMSWAGHYEAAGEAGSDFWGVYPLGDGRITFLIGDAVGTGLAGSMVAAVIKACADSAMERTSNPIGPAELLAALNAAIYQPASPSYTRCFSAMFDPGAKRIVYGNAGHSVPYRMSFGDGETKVGVLAAAGHMLGDSAGLTYRENRTSLGEREGFVLYTDGLVKTTNRAGEQFGERRLQKLLAAMSECPPHEIRDKILAAFGAFRGDGPLADDLALVVVRSKMG